MSELLPTQQATRLRQSLLDYLTTTFALADVDAQLAMAEFLSDPQHGIFKGPFIRARMPFVAADGGWPDDIAWNPPYPPYAHQAQAFERLSSARDRRPLPTLVTTGTGSGKTESFLYPILDHVVRANAAGIAGTKALILYPMNALANDQADRLAKLIARPSTPDNPNALSGVTAALYTGEQASKRTRVSDKGLITDRAIIRDQAPDILLTNYKMLDQLLLRRDDQELWRQSASSLQYIVLDEFHTYDGAQGTDVAMLLRRLGVALRDMRRQQGIVEDADTAARPLGDITPVGTSATLGGAGDSIGAEVMAEFATQVFGEPFGPDAIVTESRVPVDAWCRPDQTPVGLRPETITWSLVRELVDPDTAPFLSPDSSGAEVTSAVIDALFSTEDFGHALFRTSDEPEPLFSRPDAPPASRQVRAPQAQLDLLRTHPVLSTLLQHTADATSLGELADVLIPGVGQQSGDDAAGIAFVGHLVAALSHLRAQLGRDVPSIEAHLWIRELSRVDRVAAGQAAFRWSDDGIVLGSGAEGEMGKAFPAIYCRHCGRSGWGVELAHTGTNLSADDNSIRRNHAAKEGRFRALIHAHASETGRDAENPARQPAPHLAWFHVPQRSLSFESPQPDTPEDDEFRNGHLLPVLMITGDDAERLSRDDTCPHCEQRDGIRFLGSAIATQLSVSISTLFGAHGLDAREKKALVFTDSVQDAAHRAGFVTSRSRTLSARNVMHRAAGPDELSLVELADRILRDARTPEQRHALLPPALAQSPSMESWWKPGHQNPSASVRRTVRRRMLFDVVLEFGLNTRFGRTLEQSGAMVAHVDAGTPTAMATMARQVLERDEGGQDTLDELSGVADDQLVRWVRGVVERLRTRGAITHPWFDTFITKDGNRWFIWGGRPDRLAMPAFPRGRSHPAFARAGGVRRADPNDLLDPVGEARGWYARWTQQALGGISPVHGARLAKALMDRLAREGVLAAQHPETNPNATIYGVAPDRVLVQTTRDADLRDGHHRLTCTVCRTDTTTALETSRQLVGGPCLVVDCKGTLQPAAMDPANFYRRLYATDDLRRALAQEHTSLLDAKQRVAYENAFRNGSSDPTAPNVLVATPTLEMGIDIGDLSSVFLASLPRTVASYLQRVGRAGRLTGNALDVTFVTGRGQHLPRLGDPASMINGAVRPPSTYLSAEEILKRQYIAHLVDRFARDANTLPPGSSVLASAGPGTFLGTIVDWADTHHAELVEQFLGLFHDLRSDSADALRAWVAPHPEHGVTGLREVVDAAVLRWNREREELIHRREAIDEVLPDLRERANLAAASEDDKRTFRSAEGARRHIERELGDHDRDYWIAELERYGLLPNYTLIDDSVTLDVQLTWTDPETGDYASENEPFRRASEHALRDFAPGNTFYAKGLQIPIDSIDVGHNGQNIETWVFCQQCGYGERVEAIAPKSCPRCGNSAIRDMQSRLAVVELERVSATVRRDDSRIDDRTEDRDQRRFTVIGASDYRGDDIADQWFVESSGFGATYVRRLTMRWLNLGQRTSHARQLTIASQAQAAPLFRICEACGHLDQNAGQNSPYEHKPWCPHRTSTDEHVATVALSRTLQTQAVMLRLPWHLYRGDSFAMPSLAAAVLLGLRDQFGGSPEHIGVVEAASMQSNGEIDTLMLHDRVPGGTGYLAELARPDHVHEVLRRAYEVVRACECQDEGRLACHRCLLPYAPNGQVDLVSRKVAETHLREILDADDNGDVAAEMSWVVTDQRPETTSTDESHLEVRFRAAFRQLAERMGATVVEVPGSTGNIIEARFDRISWKLTPQLLMHGSKPDFVLSREGLPDVAIFTDGYAFHASPGHNRVADDAAKRAALVAQNKRVLGITMADIHAFEEGAPAEAPAWATTAMTGLLMQRFNFNQAAVAHGLRGPFEWLEGWMQGEQDALGHLADAVPLFLAATAPAPVDAAAPLEELARDLIVGVGSMPSGTSSAWFRQFGDVGVLVRAGIDGSVQVAVVLDDRDDRVTASDFRESWQVWLRWANLLQGRRPEWATSVTTVTGATAGTSMPAVMPETPASGESPTEAALHDAVWQSLYDEAGASLRPLIVELDAAGLPAPSQPFGVEVGRDNIPVDLVWDDMRLVAMDSPQPEDIRDLEHEGWRVVHLSFTDINAALQEARR